MSRKPKQNIRTQLVLNNNPFEVFAFIKSQNIFRALCNPIRVEILDYLNKQGSADVTSIYNHAKIHQSICSAHLRILKDCKLVLAERDVDNHRTIKYSINKATINHLKDSIDNITLI